MDGCCVFCDLLMLFRYFQYFLGECLGIFRSLDCCDLLYLFIYLFIIFYIACFHGSVNFYLPHFCSFDIVFWLLCI